MLMLDGRIVVLGGENHIPERGFSPTSAICPHVENRYRAFGRGVNGLVVPVAVGVFLNLHTPTHPIIYHGKPVD